LTADVAVEVSSK